MWVFWLRAVCFVLIKWWLWFSCFVLRCVAVCFSLFRWLLLWLLLGACLATIDLGVNSVAHRCHRIHCLLCIVLGVCGLIYDYVCTLIGFCLCGYLFMLVC